MFPGVVPAPFSVVKLGPDVSSGKTDAYSGYLPSGNITGFTLTHESGTGGAPKYGVVSQMPVLGTVPNPLADLSEPRAADDQAEVGYYKTFLSSGINVELAATNHAALLNYEFPSSSDSSIVVDVSHVLPSFRGLGLGQNYINGNITVMPDGHYEGSGTYNNGWNRAPDWTIFFCGYFDALSTSTKVFEGSDVTSYQNGSTVFVHGKDRLGAVFTFDQANVTSRVGISWISSEKACRSVNVEIPAGTLLQDLVSASKSTWNSQVFSKIQTSETDENTLQLLYSMMYGMHILPSNKTGENPLWQSSEPYYDDFFTLWDLFRCSTPLWQVLQPVTYEEIIRSLIDTWRHDDYMPDARSSNYNGRSQGGSNADNVLADAYVKGMRGAVNWEDGYSAMVKDAEVQPPNNDDPAAPDSSDKEGRGALPDWLEYGYITPEYTRAVSRAIEYSANDFALYQVAKGLGKTDDATKYLKRSQNWRNHWNPNASSLNFNGFVAPKDANGTFVDQDPLSCGGCYWGDVFYEGTPWAYSLNPHHDIYTLIDYTGGAETFVKRLDKLFEPDQNPISDDFNGTIFDPTNEPSFASPYLYNFARRQDLSVKTSRNIAKSYYNTGASGLPGNSDAGAMQTWLLWNMIGLYPLTGQTTFLIASPWFSMSIDLGSGRTLNITTTGGNSDTAFYVQSLKVNGQDWDKPWVTWEDVFAKGGTMEYVLGAEPSEWSFDGDLPPSPASQVS